MNRYFILICAALVALLVTTTGIAQADLIVEGQTYTKVFHDDFLGTGISKASDNSAGAWNTGDGLDSTKWDWRVYSTSPDVYLWRDGLTPGGTAKFYSHALETDGAQAVTEVGALDGLVGASQWAYEVVFKLYTGGDLRDNDRAIALLWDNGGTGDASYGLSNATDSANFNIDWCIGTLDTGATTLFADMSRAVGYTLQARHNADGTVDTFLFETDTPSNNWSDLGRAAMNVAPIDRIKIGDSSNRISAKMRLYSVSAGVIPEPSTLTLLTCGLIGLLCYAWRKRK